jgi:hypothetical protein
MYTICTWDIFDIICKAYTSNIYIGQFLYNSPPFPALIYILSGIEKTHQLLKKHYYGITKQDVRWVILKYIVYTISVRLRSTLFVSAGSSAVSQTRE